MPQGSPTNNTQSDGAAYTWIDDPDASFATVFKGSDDYAESDDPLARQADVEATAGAYAGERKFGRAANLPASRALLPWLSCQTD